MHEADINELLDSHDLEFTEEELKVLAENYYESQENVKKKIKMMT